jgi:hypothetical protein
MCKAVIREDLDRDELSIPAQVYEDGKLGEATWLHPRFYRNKVFSVSETDVANEDGFNTVISWDGSSWLVYSIDLDYLPNPEEGEEDE